MVVVSLEPNFSVMDRSGFASGTRAVALRLWRGRLPRRPEAELVRELYAAENKGKLEPSGSQDMIGLVYCGISRLDYDFSVEGGVFPCTLESITDRRVTNWLEQVLFVLPIQPRPESYSPLGEKHLIPRWIARLGATGKHCFEAIGQRDLAGLGASMNECMTCWQKILPQTVSHPSLKLDLPALLRVYQRQYSGAMYSGCGGGYLLVAADQPVPGASQIKVRLH